MKRLLLTLTTVSIFLTTLALAAVGQRKNELAVLPFSEAPYLVGERLTYNVSFSNFVSAAHIELFVAARGVFFGREAIQIRGHVETTGVVYAALFALNNDYTTYIDPATGQPFKSQQVVHEGARTSSATSDFNQPAGSAAIPERTLVGDFSGAYDLLSAVYRLRALPLSEGSTYFLNVRGETQEYQTELRVKGHQSVRTNVGSFNTIVSQVRVANNAVANDYRIQICFTDDERHVPVLVTVKLPTGELRAELAGSQIVPVAPAKRPAATPTPTPKTPPLKNAEGSSSTPNNVGAGLPFTLGEQLNYRVYLGSVQQPVGLVSYQVRSRARFFDHDGLMLTINAQTTNAAQRLFFANDQLTSYVDPVTLLPYRTELNLVEGRHRSNEVWTINQDYGNATKQGSPRIDIPVGTHDYLSIFYAVRLMNLSPPKRSAVSLLVNGRPKTLIITALRRETIKLDSEKIPTIQLSLTTDDQQADKFALRVWVSDDERHLPLRLTATTELGQLRADLVILPLTRQ